MTTNDSITTNNVHSLTVECTFMGEEGNPFLAPRGVIMHGNTLVVSDTGQNRIFIWNDFKGGPYQKADLVLGQPETAATERNAGAQVSGQSLQYPAGIWTNGQLLIVADAWNHRVLIWHQMPTHTGQTADVVVGQPDLRRNEPNVRGIGKSPTAQTLYWPYGVWSDGKSLWIADTGNRRVLFYKSIPQQHYTAADAVIGQQNFEEKDYDSNHAVWPYSVKLSPQGALAIADTQYYRVLLWQDWQTAFIQQADLVIGQPDMASNGQNQFGLKPAAHTLNWCYDCCFYKDGMAVADTGNSRILQWNSVPLMNNTAADYLLGQTRFDINGESSLNLQTNLTHEMYWPFAINTCGEKLVIADTGNHRILIAKQKTS